MIRRLFRQFFRAVDDRQAGRWLDSPTGCCECGTGGPYYRGDAPQVTRYIYVNACGAVGSTPDWSSCSRHQLRGVTPVVDYGRDIEVTFRQAEIDVTTAQAEATFEPLRPVDGEDDGGAS